MNGSNLLLDTNIVLYFLNGDDTLIPLFEDHTLVLSIITEIELMGFSGFTNEDLKQTKNFLKNCTIINLNEDVKNKAIEIRRDNNMKLPDAIILATATSLDIPVITADLDFKKAEFADIILYESS